MPIGKNAIKRVENNGYSKVETSAPDMENSHVIALPDPQVTETLIAPIEEKAKKPAAATKKCGAGKSSAKKPTAKKTAIKSAESKSGFERVSVGADMPYYLL